jgi:hypothetical protein
MMMGEWPKKVSGKYMSSVALGGERRCAWVLQSRARCLLPMVQGANLAMFDASSNEQRTAALSETGPPERYMVERREDLRVATS